MSEKTLYYHMKLLHLSIFAFLIILSSFFLNLSSVKATIIHSYPYSAGGTGTSMTSTQWLGTSFISTTSQSTLDAYTIYDSSSNTTGGTTYAYLYSDVARANLLCTSNSAATNNKGAGATIKFTFTNCNIAGDTKYYLYVNTSVTWNGMAWRIIDVSSSTAYVYNGAESTGRESYHIIEGTITNPPPPATSTQIIIDKSKNNFIIIITTLISAIMLVALILSRYDHSKSTSV